MPKRHPTEVRERAVRLTLDLLEDYPTMGAACRDLAPKHNVGAETLREWVTHASADADERTGPMSEELEKIKRFKCETNDILKAAASFIARMLGSRNLLWSSFILRMKATGHGVELTCDVLRTRG